MAYNELIKNFNIIREYMRSFYVYGFSSLKENVYSYQLIHAAQYIILFIRLLRQKALQTVILHYSLLFLIFCMKLLSSCRLEI